VVKNQILGGLTNDDLVVIGRVTPLVPPENHLLLEVEYSYGSWKEVAKADLPPPSANSKLPSLTTSAQEL
jgi:hypothetical protein